MTGARGGAGFWRAGLSAGLWVEQALRFYIFGFGAAVPAPHVPGHPTSMCNLGVNNNNRHHYHHNNNNNSPFCCWPKLQLESACFGPLLE